MGLDVFPEPPLILTRYPVMLMHGFGLLGGLRRGGHLHEEAMHLRLHGVLAYAPNVASYNTVEVRAEMWQDRIAHIVEETGADKINLVAQSMGGLDARYLISKLGYHEVVASLVTISTPHRGTSIAEIMLKQPERLRKWGIDIANWMGSQSLENADADTLQALTELSPTYVKETFNVEVPDHPSVQYWSYAGATGKDTNLPINPFLKLSNTLLYAREGRNDGLVSVESARWGTFVEVIDADHAQQVGIPGLTTHTFDADAFYCGIAQRLCDAGL